jgi:hypothetical protein
MLRLYRLNCWSKFVRFSSSRATEGPRLLCFWHIHTIYSFFSDRNWTAVGVWTQNLCCQFVNSLPTGIDSIFLFDGQFLRLSVCLFCAMIYNDFLNRKRRIPVCRYAESAADGLQHAGEREGARTWAHGPPAPFVYPFYFVFGVVYSYSTTFELLCLDWRTGNSLFLL